MKDNKINKILFIIDIIGAFLSIICAGLSFISNSVLLGIIWTLCAICGIYNVYLDSKN